MKRLTLALSLVVVLSGCPVPNGPHPTPDPAPVIDDMREVVAGVEPYSVPELVPFYREFADVVRRDAELIRTTGDLREIHIRAGRLAYQQTGLQEKTAGLGEQVDAALAEALGLANQKMTPELRERAVAVLEALARALE